MKEDDETLETHRKNTKGSVIVSGFVVVQLELRLMPSGVHKLRPLVQRHGVSVL